MSRFFFTVKEAVKLVTTAIANIEITKGKVLSREMKSAQIEDILRLWTKAKGGTWEKIAGRPGERDDEYLVGEIELPYTTALIFDNILHYLISFNEKAPKPLSQIVYSASAPRLSETEILDLISHPPLEEK